MKDIWNENLKSNKSKDKDFCGNGRQIELFLFVFILFRLKMMFIWFANWSRMLPFFSTIIVRGKIKIIIYNKFIYFKVTSRMLSTCARVSRLLDTRFLNWMLSKYAGKCCWCFFFGLFFVCLFVHGCTHRYRANSIKRCQLVFVDIRWRIDVHCAIVNFIIDS